MGTDGGMKVVAKRGESTYLIMVGSDPETAQGVVVDTKLQERFAPRLFQSILARGYWEPQDHSRALLDELMAIQEVD